MPSPSPHVRAARRAFLPAAAPPDRPHSWQQRDWTAVDEYVSGLLAPHDEALELALRAGEEAGLPRDPGLAAAGQAAAPAGEDDRGRARSSSSAPWAATARSGSARALPDGGRLITLEAEPRYAEVAASEHRRRRPRRRRRAAGRARLWSSCRSSSGEGAGPFDLTFIDADKVHTPRLLRLGPGALSPRQPDRLPTTSSATAGSPTPTARTRRSRLSAASTSNWRPSPGSRRRQSRPLAPRAMTDSALHLSLPDPTTSWWKNPEP